MENPFWSSFDLLWDGDSHGTPGDPRGALWFLIQVVGAIWMYVDAPIQLRPALDQTRRWFGVDRPVSTRALLREAAHLNQRAAELNDRALFGGQNQENTGYVREYITSCAAEIAYAAAYLNISECDDTQDVSAGYLEPIHREVLAFDVGTDADRMRRASEIVAKVRAEAAARHATAVLAYHESAKAHAAGTSTNQAWMDTWTTSGPWLLQAVLDTVMDPVEPSREDVSGCSPGLQVAWDWVWSREPIPVRKGWLSQVVWRCAYLGLDWHHPVERAIAERIGKPELDVVQSLLLGRAP